MQFAKYKLAKGEVERKLRLGLFDKFQSVLHFGV